MRSQIRLKPAVTAAFFGEHPVQPVQAAEAVPPSEGGHNPQLCADPDCDRLACIAYKAGYQNGYRDGYAAGYAAGYSAGYAAGQATGL